MCAFPTISRCSERSPGARGGSRHLQHLSPPSGAPCARLTELATMITGPGLTPLSLSCSPSCAVASRPWTYLPGPPNTAKLVARASNIAPMSQLRRRMPFGPWGTSSPRSPGWRQAEHGGAAAPGAIAPLCLRSRPPCSISFVIKVQHGCAAAGAERRWLGGGRDGPSLLRGPGGGGSGRTWDFCVRALHCSVQRVE